MQVVFASLVVGGIIAFLSVLVFTFAKLKVRESLINNELAEASQQLLNASMLPTKHERVVAEATAKARISKALEKHHKLLRVLA